MATIHRIGARGIYQDTEQGSHPVAAHGVQQEQAAPPAAATYSLFVVTSRTRARYRKAPTWPFTVDVNNPISRGLTYAFVTTDGWRWVDVAPATARRRTGYDPFKPVTVDASSNISRERLTDMERAPATYFYNSGSASTQQIDLGNFSGDSPMSGYTTQAMSWSVWFHLVSAGPTFPTIMDKSTSSPGVNGWILFLGYLTGSDLKPELRVNGINETMGGGVAFSTGKTNHLGLSYEQANSNNSFIVQNGVNQSFARLNTSFVQVAADAAIGGRASSSGSNFDGYIGSILMWDRAVQVYEHQELYDLRHGIFDSVKSRRSYFLSVDLPTGQPMMRRWGGTTNMPAGTGRRSW